MNRAILARRTLVCSATMLIVGVLAGFVWVWLAHPAEWEVRTNGIVLTEAAARGQFSVIVLFVVLGAVASLVWAWVATGVLRAVGWLLTPVVVVTTLAAAVIAWRLGVAFGPPGPFAVDNPAIGDRLPAKLAVDGITPFLVWPIFGLAGVLAATWTARSADDADTPQSVKA